jgi:hypothetical protein
MAGNSCSHHLITPMIAPRSRNAYVINMWHLTITDMFYVSIINAEGKVKVVPVCSVPGKTVLLNFKCYHGISCLPVLAIFFMPAFGKKPFLLAW